MLFKGFGLGLFVVLMLGTVAADYANFLRQHYDNSQKTGGKGYCNKKMKEREMTRPECKELNTFIHDATNNIKAVCVGNGGQDYPIQLPDGRVKILRRSTAQFQVTTCKMRGKSPKPPCEYRENPSRRYIVIACEDGNPVHYEEGHI
ncbi:angiogenin-2-like [Erythrolamprus reginae]|uniref:angiogenin-2-like n=1 Tax=Erythrolamprus reginae TaxID=121349 RepID=UPI00396CF3FB